MGTKNIGIILLIVTFVIIGGCSSNCINGVDNNINVSLIENIDTQQVSGLMNHHNVSINVVNIKDSIARSVSIDTSYCNDFSPQFRKCENRSFVIGDIPPKGMIKKFFEYDRTAIENTVDGKYTLQFEVKSCLPFETIDNKVYAKQRE